MGGNYRDYKQFVEVVLNILMVGNLDGIVLDHTLNQTEALKVCIFSCINNFVDNLVNTLVNTLVVGILSISIRGIRVGIILVHTMDGIAQLSMLVQVEQVLCMILVRNLGDIDQVNIKLTRFILMVVELLQLKQPLVVEWVLTL